MRTKITIDTINQHPEIMEKIAADDEYYAELKAALASGQGYVKLEDWEDETAEQEPEETGIEEDVVEAEAEDNVVESEDEDTEEGQEEPQEQEEQEVEDGGEPVEEPAEENVDTEDKGIDIHYKWRGKEYDANVNMEELTMAYQKSLKFSELKNENEMLRQKAELIDKYGLTEEKVDFFNKLMSGDQTAINQLLKKGNIDPYSLEVDDAQPIEFKDREDGFKVTKGVGELFTKIKSYSPKSYKNFVEMTDVMPTSLVNAISVDPQIAERAYLDVENGIMEKVLLRIHQRTLKDEDLAERVNSDYSDFVKLYTEEATILGFIPPKVAQGEPEANPDVTPNPADKQVSAKRVERKLQASTKVRGTSGSVKNKKDYDDMTPEEQIAFMNSFEAGSPEWEAFKQSRRNRR